MNKSNAHRVRDFHEAMNGFMPVQPAVPPADILALRELLIDEEYQEVKEAFARLMKARQGANGASAGETAVADVIGDLVHELADLLYVAYGAILACGVDPDPIFAEVHRANMAKTDGPIRDDGKQLKPPGWQPADVIGKIRQQEKL